MPIVYARRNPSRSGFNLKGLLTQTINRVLPAIVAKNMRDGRHPDLPETHVEIRWSDAGSDDINGDMLSFEIIGLISEERFETIDEREQAINDELALHIPSNISCNCFIILVSGAFHRVPGRAAPLIVRPPVGTM